MRLTEQEFLEMKVLLHTPEPRFLSRLPEGTEGQEKETGIEVRRN
jgi:hypothetical protein